MYRQYTLRNTAAFLITALACVHNAAHAALELVTIDTKQQEVKEQPTIPQPPQELRDALNIHIGTSALRNIIYEYLCGSEIHKDHARFLRFMRDRIINTAQKAHLEEFKFVYDYDDNSNQVDAADKQWIESYVRVEFSDGLKKIKDERDATKNFFEYGFDNLIRLLEYEYALKYNKHFLEYLLSNCDHIKPQPMDMEVVEEVATLLIKSKAPVNAYLQGRSATPLRAAIDDFKSPKLVQLMLKHKADPNYRCYDSWPEPHSPLFKSSYVHQVDEQSNLQIVKSLLDAQANPYAPYWIQPTTITALKRIDLKASEYQELALTGGVTEDDRKKADRLTQLAQMFDDAARAQQKHLKQDD